MSGCSPHYTVGNVAFAQPVTAPSCGCPCHFNREGSCWCGCASHLKIDMHQGSSALIELKIIKNELSVLRETINSVKNCINSKPHKCPVCNGKCGHTVYIEDDLEDVFIDCKVCKGKGVLWDITDA